MYYSDINIFIASNDLISLYLIIISVVLLSSTTTSIVILDFSPKIKIKVNHINFNDPRCSDLGQRIIFFSNLKEEFFSKNNFIKKDFKFYRELMIKNLVPYSTKDLEINKSLLLENNFEAINAIDWDKGCYVGQEITARMKYRALLKKNIRAVKILSGKVNPGNEIYNNQNIIGKIISCHNNLAIAMLKIEEAKDVFNNEIILKTDSSSLKIIN